MTADTREDAPLPRHTQVAVVGAGPAGSLFAAVLAESGKDVVVLEAGPAWQPDDLFSSQIWARRLKWGGTPTLRGGADPLGTGFTGGWGFGGAALHHYGGWPRLLPDDFRLRSRFGVGADWPIGHEELYPFYDRIQAEIGIAGDIAREPDRPDRTPYPMPPLPAFPQALQLARGFERLGRRTYPTPAAINTIARAGRPACIWDGWCDAGCPTGALANPLVTTLARARRAGAHFAAHTTVARVTATGSRATGVEYVAADGRRDILKADIVVLAGGAIQNARLLLGSATASHPDGPGNRNRLVGRYFAYHVVVNVYGLFDEDLQNHLGTTVPALTGEAATPRHRAGGPFGYYNWGLGPALKPNDLLGIAMSRPDLFGARLDTFMREASRHLASMAAVIETVPGAGNRIELADTRDAKGMAHARLVNAHAPGTRALAALAASDGDALLRAAGAHSTWTAPMVAAHQLGGTRMGVDPATSVTDSYGRVHGIAGLFVAGGGLFPTCGTTAPTFTIHALTLRAAEHLARTWPRGP